MLASNVGLLLLIAVTGVVSQKRQLVVLLVDGFRWNYMDLLNDDIIGGFRYFKNDGVRAEYVVPVFPSDQHPSWTSLVTGVYPEKHGVLGNEMYNKKRQAIVTLEERNSSSGRPVWWQNVEPIWTTAIKSGLQVCTMGWPGSELAVDGIVPEYTAGSDNLDISIHNTLLKLRDGVDLVMVRHDDVDDVGRTYGPDSKAMTVVLINLAKAIEKLIQGIENLNMEETVDIVLVSGYGMTSNCYLRKVKLEQHINMADALKIFDKNTHIEIFAKSRKIYEIYDDLIQVPGFKVAYKHEIPAQFHYRNAMYVPDILMYAMFEWKAICPKGLGVVGFEPTVSDMRGAFMGYGNSFRQRGVEVKGIQLVDVYQMLCGILLLQPAQNDGSPEVAHCFWNYADDVDRERCDILKDVPALRSNDKELFDNNDEEEEEEDDNTIEEYSDKGHRNMNVSVATRVGVTVRLVICLSSFDVALRLFPNLNFLSHFM